MQKLQPLLMLPAPVEIQAGGKEPQADVGMVLDKHSQFRRTGGAGAPCQVAGDFKSLGPVQPQQCPDIVNKADFCMALFLERVPDREKRGLVTTQRPEVA